MRRVVCHRIGSLEDLTIEQVEPLVPAPGQVVIDVRAAGMAFVDALMISGGYQIKPPTPYTPGTEVAGVVSAVGGGVEGVSVGDRASRVDLLRAGCVPRPELRDGVVLPHPPHDGLPG